MPLIELDYGANPIAPMNMSFRVVAYSIGELNAFDDGWQPRVILEGYDLVGSTLPKHWTWGAVHLPASVWRSSDEVIYGHTFVTIGQQLAEVIEVPVAVFPESFPSADCSVYANLDKLLAGSILFSSGNPLNPSSVKHFEDLDATNESAAKVNGILSKMLTDGATGSAVHHVIK